MQSGDVSSALLSQSQMVLKAGGRDQFHRCSGVNETKKHNVMHPPLGMPLLFVTEPCAHVCNPVEELKNVHQPLHRKMG